MLIYASFPYLVSYSKILNLSTLPSEQKADIEQLFIHNPHDTVHEVYKDQESLVHAIKTYRIGSVDV